MADQRITELVELPQGGVASSDVLPIADVSASQTKKVQVKSLIQAGFNLADSSTLDIAKINQASATKLTGTSIASGTITYDKLQAVSANKLLGRTTSSGTVEEIDCTVYIRTLLDDANAAAARSTLELGAVATGNTISTALLEDLSVATGKIDDLAVTTAKLASGSVETSKISDGAVTSTKIETSGITAANISAGAVDTAQLADGSVTLIKMGASSVDTTQLVDSGITQSKLAASSVDSINLVDSGVTQSKLAADAVAGINLVDSGITQGKLAADSVATANLIDGSVTHLKIASGAIDTFNLIDSGVTTDKLADGSVTVGKLSLSSGDLSGTVITASSIPLGSYEADSITTDSIADNAVTFAKIQQVSTDVLLGRSSAGSGNVEAIALTSAGRALLDDVDAAEQRSTLGLDSMAVQAASSVAITGGTATLSSATITSATINGGTISGITDLAIADGGTGASTAADARTNLGLAIGVDVQAYDDALASIAGLTTSANQIIYTTGTDTYATSSITAAGRDLLDDADASAQRSTLGLGSLAIQNTVASGNYDALSINTGDIADGAITAAKIATSGVTTVKIADANVTADKLASNAVTTAKIIDSGVTTDKVASGAITYSKIQATSQSDVLIGRFTASGGSVEEIPCTAAARSILDDASIADIRTTLGLGTLATQNGSFSGTSTGTNTGDQTIVLTGDVTGTGTGTFATTIANNAIVEEKINDSAVSANKVASGAITATKLADQSSVVVVADSPSASGTFIGQQWFNTNNSYEYTWDGAQWIQQAALNAVTVSGDAVYSFASSYPDNFSAAVTANLNNQAANRVLIGPASGSDAAPTFRALQAVDLPAATASTQGVVIPGAGLVMASNVINHINSTTSGTYYKVSVDTEGHVVSGASTLEPADIPSLDASKITTGTFGSGFIGDNAVLGTNLADYSVTHFGETSPAAEFIGQFFFNPLEKDLFLWDGNVWNPVGISIGEIIFAGTYNASGNVIASTTTAGAAIGLSVGQPLPGASTSFSSYYVVVASGGTGVSPAPEVVLQPPDIILCNGTAWVEVDVSSTFVAQNAANVAFSPAANLGSTNVQSALEEVSTECRNANNIVNGILDEAYGGTGFNSYTKGDLLAASGSTGFSQLAIGTNGQVLTADSAQTAGMRWVTPTSGTVLSVNATAPLFVVSGSTTPHLTVSGATTSAVGVVQLSDSVSTTSSVLAATPTAVKTAYDLANAALPAAGGTITGELLIGNTGSLVFEGSTNDGFETTLTVADPTADRTITLPNITGTVITNADTGTVTNGMLAGSIADTKLNTISTAGKVSNSATTATSANTASAIVARDASGNFSAGTINATIDDGTY